MQNKLAIHLRAIPLVIESAFFVVVPFVRTVILTHLLVPYEFGFVSALAATSATFEQITDIAISNFVFSSPRSVYTSAVAGAHAISIIRGVCVGGLMLLMAKPVACTLATCNDWTSFAWLAPATMINSFAHLEIRVNAVRDYRYWPMAITSIVSHTCGLLILYIVTKKFENHYGYVGYLLVQSLAYVFLTHLLATHRYAFDFRSPYIRRSIAFGLPLLINGVGLAIMSQGDRWIVGSMLGLPLLGIYSVITLAGFVPVSGLLRIVSPLQFAGLHNASMETGQYEARLKLYTRAVPLVAGVSALGIIALYGRLLPAVFGTRFTISDGMLFLLASIVYVRIIRTEPQGSLLLNAQDTRHLAIAGQAPFLGLLAMIGLVMIRPTLESVLIGILIGEIAGLCITGYVSRHLLSSAVYDHVFSVLLMFVITVGAEISLLATTRSGLFIDRLTIAGAFLVIALACGFPPVRSLLKKAYGRT